MNGDGKTSGNGSMSPFGDGKGGASMGSKIGDKTSYQVSTGPNEDIDPKTKIGDGSNAKIYPQKGQSADVTYTDKGGKKPFKI